METGESAFQDLMAQYNSIDKVTGSFQETALPPLSLEVPTLPWYKRYMVFLVCFVWTVVFVIIGKPNIMYEEDKDTKQLRIRPMRLLITTITVFLSLLGLYFGLKFFHTEV